jgi:NAD(P)-dependent dehydrogenase (short-subunit alcohol dehydrogenase family)
MIANAGAAVSAPFMKSGPEIFRQMMDVNLLGVTNFAHAVLPSMTERGHGRIVAVASTAGLKGYPYVSAYCASKHAVVGFVRALALETAKTGVTVNAVCPGWVLTPLVERQIARRAEEAGTSTEAAARELLAEKQPMLRFSTPEHIAAAVLYLCSAGAETVTGTHLSVDGGWTAQ